MRVSDKEMTPRVRQHPEARPTESRGTVDTTSLAHDAHPSTTTAEKPRRRSCAACGKSSGSISAGTGFPLVRDRETGAWFHVRCRLAAASPRLLAELGA